MSSNNTKLYGILVIVILVAGGALAALYLFQPQPEETDVPAVLVVGRDATSVNVSLTDMLSMTTITKNGSFQNSEGNIGGLGSYTGVKVSDLLDLVGGTEENDTVRVTAIDGYNMTFDRSKVYPNASFLEIQGDMVLAFEFNGTTVPEYADGFRIAFLPEDEYYSNADANETTDPDPRGAGPQWVRNVVKIEVIPPEPTALILNYEDTTISFTMSELMAMTPTSGEGGYKRQSGTIIEPLSVTGVAFSTLLDYLPALPADYNLTALSSDEVITEYTKAMVEGNLSGYNSSGGPLELIQSTMVLAYEIGGSPIPSQDGPLRIAFINEDGNLTDGSLWAKMVVNITITALPMAAGQDGGPSAGVLIRTGGDIIQAEVKF